MTLQLHHLHTDGPKPLYKKITADEYERMTARIDELQSENAKLKEKRRWRKFPEEKPSEEMEGEDFLVSNGYYSVVCEWRGYWNNEPFCGDKNCDVVKFWMPMPSAPKEEK